MKLTGKKTNRMESESQFLISIGMPVKERVERLRALSGLLDTGWPDAFINNKMLNRAVLGQVPKYEGVKSLREYEERWST
jgi:hypothetical protein